MRQSVSGSVLFYEHFFGFFRKDLFNVKNNYGKKCLVYTMCVFLNLSDRSTLVLHLAIDMVG